MKTLQELTLLDKFLFDEAMDDTETYEALLRIILGDEQLKLLSEAQTEKEFRTMPWLRSIRVDVFSIDSLGTIYNTEMQKEKRDDLIKRMRYYQALIDSSLLEPGVVNFNEMKNTTIIMIMPFDMFGKDRYIYTIGGVCKEDNSIVMNDGTNKIFINTHGKNKDEVSPEFVALMNFIEYNQSVDEEVQDSNLKRIMDRVSAIKASEKVGVKYMQQWEVEAIIKNEGREEGLVEGREEGREEERLILIRNVMDSLKLSVEEAMNALKIPEDKRALYLEQLK